MLSKVNSTDNSFSILTEEIIKVETDSTEAYTFRIEIPTNPTSEFENFIIEKNADNVYNFYIFRYQETIELDSEEIINTLSRELLDPNIINLNDFNNYLGKMMYAGYDETTECLYTINYSEDCTCEYLQIIWCKEDGAGGVSSNSGSSGNSGNSGGDNGNTGSNSGSLGNNPHSNGSSSSSSSSTVGVLIPAEASNNGCKKIKKIFEDYPDYKSALITLATKVTENVENGIYIDKASNNIHNIPQGVGGKIDFNNNPTNKYITFAHTHDASGTYSIFSWDDMALMARTLENYKIKNTKFVAFLITEKGTRYALTITSSSKLIDFFYKHKDTDATVDVDKYIKMQKVYDKYYNDSTAIIKKTNSDNIAVRNAFLKMMKENDLGLELFEADANFENFEKLELDENNNIIPNNNCN